MIKFIKNLLGWHIHDWEPWKDTFRVHGSYTDIVNQERYCKTCGKGESRSF